MSISNRRNAFVSLVALNAASRALGKRRGRKRPGGFKAGLVIGLGVVSLGVLAGLAAVYLRKRRPEPQHLEGFAEAEAEEPASAEQEAAPAEPVPATT